jgi:predicted NBD/HSP70 family sugar kinase
MAREKSKAVFFRIRPQNDREQLALEVFHYCLSKKKVFNMTELLTCLSRTGNFLEDYIALCLKKGVLVQDGDNVRFNAGYGKTLGIGFYNGECFVTLVDMAGDVVEKESFPLSPPTVKKLKSKDIAAITKEIGERSSLCKRGDVKCAGVAIPERISADPKGVEAFSKGLAGSVKNGKVYAVMSATASGYGDREKLDIGKNEDVLYMYSDAGVGVVFKKELIFEADEYGDEKFGAYLRPWNQFSIVENAKALVSKGVGTLVVEMVKGDIDSITLDVVLAAAGLGDELSEELVRRSGIALGVRVAYLVKMFNAGAIVFGGGIEKNNGGFVGYVKESMAKFVSQEVMGAIKIIQGVLGREAPSVGAALLCRREIFMEV